MDEKLLFDAPFSVTNEAELAQFVQTVTNLAAQGKVKLGKGMGDSRIPNDLKTVPATKFELVLPPTGFTSQFSKQYKTVRITVKGVSYPSTDGTSKEGDFSFNLPAALLPTLQMGMTIPLVASQMKNERGLTVEFITFDRTANENVPSLSTLIGAKGPEQGINDRIAALSPEKKKEYLENVKAGFSKEEALDLVTQS